MKKMSNDNINFYEKNWQFCKTLIEGRKAVGGQLEIKMRVRNPIGTKQIEKVEEKWLVIVFR